MEMILELTVNQKSTGMAIFKSDKIGFKSNQTKNVIP